MNLLDRVMNPLDQVVVQITMEDDEELELALALSLSLTDNAAAPLEAPRLAVAPPAPLCRSAAPSAPRDHSKRRRRARSEESDEEALQLGLAFSLSSLEGGNDRGSQEVAPGATLGEGDTDFSLAVQLLDVYGAAGSETRKDAHNGGTDGGVTYSDGDVAAGATSSDGDVADEATSSDGDVVDEATSSDGDVADEAMSSNGRRNGNGRATAVRRSYRRAPPTKLGGQRRAPQPRRRHEAQPLNAWPAESPSDTRRQAVDPSVRTAKCVRPLAVDCPVILDHLRTANSLGKMTSLRRSQEHRLTQRQRESLYTARRLLFTVLTGSADAVPKADPPWQSEAPLFASNSAEQPASAVRSTGHVKVTPGPADGAALGTPGNVGGIARVEGFTRERLIKVMRAVNITATEAEAEAMMSLWRSVETTANPIEVVFSNEKAKAVVAVRKRRRLEKAVWAEEYRLETLKSPGKEKAGKRAMGNRKPEKGSQRSFLRTL